MADAEHDARAKDRALIRRDSTVTRIRQIHHLATRASTDPAARAQLVAAIQYLDALWSSFVLENSGVMYILSKMGLLAEFSMNLETDIRALVVEAKAMCNNVQPASVVSVGSDQQVTYEVPVDNSCTSAGSSKDHTPPYSQMALVPARLSEIPLPYFDGECKHWPAFRDRFSSLVVTNPNISNTHKFYYLIGCLHTDLQEVVRGFTVSNDSFTLAWDALVERYDKPRMLASSIMNKLISAPVVASETQASLQSFLSAFDENLAILESLQIPNLTSFMLFSLAARCLPTSSRRLFESENTEEYPSVQSVIKFVKARQQVLANAEIQAPGSSLQLIKSKSQGPRRGSQTSFVSATKTSALKCWQCSGAHRLADCITFKAASVDERYNTVCTYRLCMVCLRKGHMSFKCPKSCSICNGRHHALLHRDANPNRLSRQLGRKLGHARAGRNTY